MMPIATPVEAARQVATEFVEQKLDDTAIDEYANELISSTREGP